MLVALVQLVGADAHAQPATFGANAQHTAIYEPRAQPLNRMYWSTPVNLNNSGGAAHYGAPLITPSNSIVIPVRTTTGFKLRVVEGVTGALKYELTTDYTIPTSTWVPTYQPVLATHPGATRLYYPGRGGTVYYIENPDTTNPAPPIQVCFYTTLTNYKANSNAFNTTVYVNTPITADTNGVIFFGFRVETNGAPAPLSTTQGGFARIDPEGNAIYVLAGDAAEDVQIFRDSHSCAPALSNDGSTLYVTVKSFLSGYYSYLLGLDSTNLTTKYKVFLRDPRNNNPAGILDIATASPTIGPDGDVYIGVSANPNNGSRGFLLHFSGDLATNKTPGGFGWDFTPAIVPTNFVPWYTGTSPYLLFSKYNNYAGNADGDGVNKLALLDPNATQIDPHPTASGLVEMREVRTVNGCAPDPNYLGGTYRYAVREWCINTAAVNPITKSVLAPCEDGYIYCWDFASDSLSQAFRTGPGIGQPYVPTVIGPDGVIYTMNGGTLFALGGFTNLAIELNSSIPDLRTAIAGQSITFTAVVTNLNPADPVPTGTVTFRALYYLGVLPVTNVLATDVPLTNGIASVTTSALDAGEANFGNHLVTAIYSGDTNFQSIAITRVQKVHASASSLALLSAVSESGSNSVIFTATVASSPAGGGVPSGMVSFWDRSTLLAQMPLNTNGIAKYTNTFSPGPRAIGARYHGNTVFATSQGAITASEPYSVAISKLADGSSRIFFTNVSGAPFTVLSSTNLSAPYDDWAESGAAQEINPGQFEFLDADVVEATRFYHIRSP